MKKAYQHVYACLFIIFVAVLFTFAALRHAGFPPAADTPQDTDMPVLPSDEDGMEITTNDGDTLWIVNPSQLEDSMHGGDVEFIWTPKD